MMKLQEKLDALQTNHMSMWLSARQEAWDEMSDACSMFCVCGRLCTGLHEQNCRKFQDKVTKKAVEKLSYLLGRE
jgi:hypothetical protein